MFSHQASPEKSTDAGEEYSSGRSPCRETKNQEKLIKKRLGNVGLSCCGGGSRGA